MDDDILKDKDVFDYHNVPSVEDAPVLPEFNETADFDIVVNKNGKLYIFHRNPLPVKVEWVEYDIDSASLYFVSPEGHIQDLGIRIGEPLRPYMRKSTHICTVEVHPGGKTGEIFDLPVTVRDTGL